MKLRYKYKDPKTIEQILEKCETIAVVGLSSKESRAGYYVPAYMQRQGYRIIPVNPHIEAALGEKSYADLASIPEKIDLVLLFRRSDAVPPFVEDAIEVGARAVWMQQGIVNLPAAERANQAGLDVVMSACIMVEHRNWMASKEKLA